MWVCIEDFPAPRTSMMGLATRNCPTQARRFGASKIAWINFKTSNHSIL